MVKLPSPKTVKSRKRIGRGGVHGRHTVGRGQKGQKSRSGYKSPRPGFEGGRMPLSRRVPKLKGFKRGYFDARTNCIILNVSTLEQMYKANETVSIETLVEKGLNLKMNKTNKIKILGKGQITVSLNVIDMKVSESAQQKIEKAGGSVK